MTRTLKTMFLALMILGSATAVMADDVTGSDVLLCSSAQVTICYASGECEMAPPWELNIPDFVEIDLSKKILRTTQASGENRSTPIKNIERVEGLLAMQGFEEGRAFSFVIHEKTGKLSVAVAREDINVGVFGSCTPIPSRQEER